MGYFVAFVIVAILINCLDHKHPSSKYSTRKCN
jgi:hypothetical protein